MSEEVAEAVLGHMKKGVVESTTGTPTTRSAESGCVSFSTLRGFVIRLINSDSNCFANYLPEVARRRATIYPLDHPLLLRNQLS